MDNGSWTKLFHPRGPQVTIALGADIKTLLADIDFLLSQGFLVDAPGVEPGQDIEEVAYVVRGEHESEGQTTPFVLLYSGHDQMKWSFLKVYFNDNKQIADFESASGMKLMSVPQYIGQDKPERGKSKAIDKFIVPAPRPFKVVLKQNPKWKQEDADAAKAKNAMYSVPKRIFIRWADQPAATDKPAEAEKPQQTVAEKARAYIGGLADATALSKAGAMLDERRTAGSLSEDEHAELTAMVMKKLDEQGVF